MTDERLSEIKARLAAATEGPWQLEGPEPHDFKGEQFLIVKAAEDWFPALILAEFDTRDNVEPQIQGDAEFIAHSRQDIEDLIAEVERLRPLQ